MRILLALITVILTACSSQSSVSSKPVTESEPTDGRTRAAAHTGLAGEYYARGNWAVALAESREALKWDSNYYPAYNMQGLIYMELREDGPAREAFERSLSLSGNNPDVQNNYGWFLCTRNDPNRGLDLMQRALSNPLYSTPEKAFLSRGLCLKRMGRTPEAEESLRRAVLIRPDMIGALYNLAILSYERGAMKDAENYMSRYMRLTTPTLEGLVYGVKIARASGDSASEQSYLQQMRRRFPDTPELSELEKSR
ncbi:MAG TPA: type IV pilus biogenesis/stability protein PilW [Usitatibacter sp.]|nr:type IV pilus biogenesis/stability protein PilW [Usitatibacter sp.]